jgi:HAMP domain-containing protein
MKTLRTKITKELEKEHNDEIKTLKNKIKKLTISLKKAQDQLFDNDLENC